jgi:hypothetical protein
MLDPLYDVGSSCGESSDLDAIVEVMALGDVIRLKRIYNF